MKPNYRAASPVLSLLFGICLEMNICKSSMSAIVELRSNLKCTSGWQTIQLAWNSMVDSSANSLYLQNSSSFWEHRSEAYKKTTAAHLLSAVKYGTNLTSYSCHGNVSAYTPSNNSQTWNRKLSFLVEVTRAGSQLVGLRYVQLGKNIYSNNQLQVYLRLQKSLVNNVNYSLTYCWVDKFKLDPESKVACPKYTSVRFTCLRGLICVAVIGRPHVYSAYRFHIVATKKTFTSKSEVFRVCTKLSSDRKTDCAKPGEFTAILISRKVDYLIARPTELREVILQWPVNNAIFYELSYNCSNGANTSWIVEQRSKTIANNIEFQPYLLCRFCIKVFFVYNSIGSEPVCNTTRLLEEIPSQGPTITCNSSTCPFTREGQIRNVTLTCELPPKRTWNGVLTKLVVKYRNETNITEYREFSLLNVSSCSSVITGLSTKSNYFVTMLACNVKGCSGIGNEIIIPRLDKTDINSSSHLSVWWLVIVIPVVILVFCSVVFYYQVNERKRLALPSVEEPRGYEEMEDQTGSHSGCYDQLPEDDNANRNIPVNIVLDVSTANTSQSQPSEVKSESDNLANSTLI